MRREPHINVVAISEKPKFIMEFWKWHMSGYITGEVTREKVLEELDNLRYEPYWEEAELQLEKQLRFENEQKERKYV